MVLDRAAALHEAGLRTAALTAFPMHASDRNLAIVAAPAHLASPSLAGADAGDAAATELAEGGGGAELVCGARARLCVTPAAGLRLRIELVCRAAAAGDGGDARREVAAWEDEARCTPCDERG